MSKTPWSDDHYNARTKARKSAGTSAFAHTAKVKSGTVAAETHKDLDPKGITRESRDSDNFPNSNAIGVIFDVTGSMGTIPEALQLKLPNLLGMLTRKGYIEDPAICFGAIGDALSDKAPIQIGQFESGNEMEDDLSKIFIEGYGGGNTRESYDLAMYFFAYHTKIDCWEKRGDKGYLFTIGDENYYDVVRKTWIKEYFGDSVQEDIPIEQVVSKLKERYHYFHILPENAYNSGNASIKESWKKLLGQNLLTLDNPDAVCEVIALAIGMMEDNTDMDTAKTDLADYGTSDSIIESASRSVVILSSGKGVSTTGSFPDAEEGGTTERL